MQLSDFLLLKPREAINLVDKVAFGGGAIVKLKFHPLFLRWYILFKNSVFITNKMHLFIYTIYFLEVETVVIKQIRK